MEGKQMADKRCPMCGKPNPEERETCQFCDARLKPLIIKPPERESPVQPGEPATSKNTNDLPSNLPGWLPNIQPSEAPPAPDTPSGEGIPDWLLDMRTDFDASSEESEEAEAGEVDWLSRLGATEPVQEKQGDSGLPDWLSGGKLSAPRSEKEDISDWLSSAEEPEATAGRAMPDWLSGLGAEPVKPSGDALPDWLSSPPQEAHGPSRDSAPDWLTGSQAEAQEPAGESESLDWLNQFSADQPAEPKEKAPQTPEFDRHLAAEALDWSKDQGAVEPTAASQELESQEVEDWLSGLHAETVSDEAANLPAWDQEKPEPAAPLPETGVPAEAEPDWLKELESTFSEMPAVQPLTSEPADESKGSQPISPFAIGPEDMGIALESALPGWLSEATADGKPMPEGIDVTVPGLSPGDLPSWLEAMRPVEAVGGPGSGGEEAGEAEGAGPLAGLRGVLPAEPDIAYVRKPPPYSIKLQVLDVQQAQADLFGQLIKTEGEAQPIPARPVITPQHILRILIGLVLTLSILAPLIVGVPAFNPPQILGDTFAGEFMAHQAVEGLAPGQPVLLVIDYEPGYSAEMEATAGAVLDHLMLKGAFLALVSTSPSGPIQAEHLVAKVKEVSGHSVTSPQNYLDLGFVPGGTTGLLSFIEDPRSTLPVAWGGLKAWEVPALQNVAALDGFALVIVATDNPETARAWIEQAYPRLNGKPLVMVVSAQAGPMVRPYFDAYPRQIQGLVSGLAGGAAYESTFGRSGSATTYWGSFSLGLLTACLLIILGGALNAASFLLALGKETTRKEGESK
jgi:hypothetical protein